MASRDMARARGPRGAARGAGGRRAPPRLRLAFPGVARALDLPDDGVLAPALLSCARGWEPARQALAPARAGAAPLPQRGVVGAAVARGAGRYDLHSLLTDRPIRRLPAASAVCALLADLAQEMCERPGRLGLHCAAFRASPGDGGLVLLAGRQRMGKSTLAARLALEPGVEVFCDDVLPILPDGEAMALGLPPRLRLPLPEGASEAFRDGVARHMGLRDDRYGYLQAPSVAPHGARAPVGALVALDRREGPTPARLHPLSPAEGIELLLSQALNGFRSAGAALAAARRLLDGTACLRLVYSDLEEATALLVALARGEAEVGPADDALAPLPGLAPDAGPPVDPARRIRPAPGVAVRRVGVASMLWRPGAGRLWSLNPVAAAAWALLPPQASARELAGMLAPACPGVGVETLEADLAAWLGSLVAAGLAEPAAPALRARAA